jgi:hypothetical protein
VEQVLRSGGAGDNQKALDNRYRRRQGQAVHPPDAGRAPLILTVFSRLAPGWRGGGRRPGAARGRVSVGTKSPLPVLACSFVSVPSPCPEFLTLVSSGRAALIQYDTRIPFHPQGERGVCGSLRPADPGERKSWG